MAKSARTRMAERIRQNEWAFLDPMEKLPGVPSVTESTSKWRGGDSRHHFIDNGADILLVAHCDSVAHGNFLKVDSQVLRCPSLDNRIGVYLALVELPMRGIKFDVLLTDDEEMCNSSAQHFKTEKKYNWMFSFDRMGFDCALYQYIDDDTRAAVKAHGYNPVYGSYSDIVELDNLGCKGFNFGIGYRNYHSKDSHIFMGDLVKLVQMFTSFYTANKDVAFPHTPAKHGYGRNRYAWDDDFGPYSGYVSKYTGSWKTRSTGNAVKIRVGAGKSSYSRDKWNSDLDAWVSAYRDTTDTTTAVAGAEEWEDDAFPEDVEAVKCEFCETFHDPHHIAYDLHNEVFLCDDCYEHINGVRVAERHDTLNDLRNGHRKSSGRRKDEQPVCHDCNADDDSVQQHDVYGVKLDLCADCYDFYLNGVVH